MPEPSPAPTAVQAVTAVMRDVQAVGKGRYNQGQKFNFRGIDDLMNAVAVPLRTHGVLVVPTVVDRTSEVRGKMTAVWLTVRFQFFGPAGDCVEATTVGEAADVFDKATNKAMSAALKYALLQVLMIPVEGSYIEDSDRHNPEGVRNPDPEPSEADELFTAIRGAWGDLGQLRTILGQAQDRGSVNLMLADPDGQPIAAGQLLQRRIRHLESAHADVDEAAVARGELFDAAQEAGFDPSRAETEFTNSYGCSIAQASVAQLREMRDLLLESVKR